MFSFSFALLYDLLKSQFWLMEVSLKNLNLGED